MKASKILLFSSMVLFAFELSAQPAPPQGNPTPIGGVAILAAAGVAYGSKKVMDMKKKQD